MCVVIGARVYVYVCVWLLELGCMYMYVCVVIGARVYVYVCVWLLELGCMYMCVCGYWS